MPNISLPSDGRNPRAVLQPLGVSHKYMNFRELLSSPIFHAVREMYFGYYKNLKDTLMLKQIVVRGGEFPDKFYT